MSEYHEHVAVISWANSVLGLYPELALLYHPASGEYRPKPTARRLKAMGVKPGVPDLHLPVPRGGYCGLWVELKYGSNKPTANQTWWIGQLTALGHKCYICWSFEEAVRIITEYLAEQ